LGLVGEHAERLVEERVRAVLPDGVRCYSNVSFVARTRADKPAHEGEADLVVVHPEFGILVIETKAGQPRRDGGGDWFIGEHRLDRSPFEQAAAAKRDLLNAICDVLALPGDRKPRAGHAVAFPDADLASLPRGHVLLGPDAEPAIILDAAALADPASTRRALERAWDWWVGDGSRGYPFTAAQLDRVDEYLAPTATLHRLLRRDVDAGRERLLAASNAQRIVLNQQRSKRRLEIVGPAGSGKSLVAVEKARRLARDGWRTLFVCFNQPLATAVLREIEEDGEPADRRPHVTTFHRLCETLGTRAGVLPAKPDGGDLPREWWDRALPAALDAAIDRLPDERYHAVVVDEGQDFELPWLESLGFLLFEPDDDIFWVFHDPGQALFRDDRVAELGLDRIDLFEDYRSPRPVAELAARFYRGPLEPYAVTEGGTPPVVIPAAPRRDTTEAVRKQLHHLLEDEGIRSWNIAVLSGGSAVRSEVWRQREFGNARLWNGAIDDEGRSLRLAAEDVPEVPAENGVVLFETVRRFKGLERPVVILCELPEEAERLDALLYTGLTRATAHLVVIAPPALAGRLEPAVQPR